MKIRSSTQQHTNGSLIRMCIVAVAVLIVAAVLVLVVSGKDRACYNPLLVVGLAHSEKDEPPRQIEEKNAHTTLAQKQSDWPGIPKEDIGNALVRKGSSFVDNSRQLFLDTMDEFLAVYAARPDEVNLCGIRVNHAYALFIAIRALKPTAIIESGVNAGVSTYIMRAAAPDAKIYCIDPLDKPICGQKTRWIDEKNAVYFTGNDFKDIGDIDWGDMIRKKELDPDSTLVFLDDHQAVFERFPALMKNGFRHVLLEDNYKRGEGATTLDKAGWTPKQMFQRVNDYDAEFLWHNMKRYAEFPPLVPPIVGVKNDTPRKRSGGFMHPNDGNSDIVEPLFRPDKNAGDKLLYEKICKELGIDPELKDSASYMQIMNYNQFSYFELVPFAPHLRNSKWT